VNIILAGIMGRYPYGGVAWCSLMYLLGLRRLGHRVWYLEDTGECNYDPVANTIATEPDYATRFIYECLAPHDLGESWCYVDYTGRHHGRSRFEWMRICAEADLFLDLSGGCWFWRDEYAAIPHSAFIDSDPAFTQLALSRGNEWYVNFFRRFDRLFTFGRNIGTKACAVPVDGWEWEPTWQPVDLDEWKPAPAHRRTFTTIMSWMIDSFSDIGGNKDREFHKVLSLPSMVTTPLEIALATRPPQERLARYGWKCRDAFPVSRDLDTYRNYIRSSMGEFSVAKHTYVQTRSGWFSDRTECYLASGRPAVVQDTGFSAHLPTGAGLFAYDTSAEAAVAIERVVADWPRHSAAAREIARTHFAFDVVLPPLLERATSPRRPAPPRATDVDMFSGDTPCELRR
jgi:hypothetical protein